MESHASRWTGPADVAEQAAAGTAGPRFSDVAGFDYHESLPLPNDTARVHVPDALYRELCVGMSGAIRGWAHERGASLSVREDDGSAVIGSASTVLALPDPLQQRVFVWSGPDPEAWVSDTADWRPAALCVYDPASESFARARGLVRVEQLATKTVLFAGIGSLGSEVAIRLAQQGVGRIRLADPDVLGIENIARHRLDVADVGRLKVSAMAEALRRVNPLIEVEEDAVNILQPDYMLREVVRDADLVVCTVDKVLPRHVLNRLCIDEGRLAIYAGFYANAAASEIVWVQPGATPCLECLHPEVAEKPSGDVPYAGQAGSPGEPGLSIDIGHGASVAAAAAIALLDGGARAAAFPASFNRILVHSGSRPSGVFSVDFSEPFQVRWVLTARRSGCAVCGHVGHSENRADSTYMTREG